MEKHLTDLKPGEEGKILAIRGGHGMQRRLRSLGLGEGHLIRKLSNVGWSGPVVIEVNRAQVAIGFGMARRITVLIDANKTS